MATHASDAGIEGNGSGLAGGRESGVTAHAIGGLGGPGAEGVMAMAGVAVGGFDLFPVDIDTAVGAGFELLFFGQVAVTTELGYFGGGGDLVGGDVADGGAVFVGEAMADTAIDTGGGVFMGFEIGEGFGVAGGATMRLLGRGGEGREEEKH